MEALSDHPAPWHPKLLAVVARMAIEEQGRWMDGQRLRVLDPFAGTGRIHLLPSMVAATIQDVPVSTVGVEIEAEWAACHPDTVHGNALVYPEEWKADRPFQMVATDPTYGNRMADKHDPKDACKACDGDGCKACKGSGLSRRHTYRHTLGRQLDPSSSGGLQWGKGYRQFHELWLQRTLEVVQPDSLVVVAMKNHIRDGVEQLVAEWWVNMLLYQRCRLQEVVPVALNGVTHGRNHGLRTEYTFLIAVRTPV